MSDTFTDYKGVTKSLNPAINVSCKVDVPIKTTPPPKRGRVSQQKNAPTKRLRTMRKTSSSKTVNTSQPKIDGHQVDTINPQLIPPIHTIEQARGSEYPGSLILGNHDEIHGVQEMSINYTNSGELFDCTTTVVNSSFLDMVADLINDPDHKTMAECK
jgi:hypothetical protein